MFELISGEACHKSRVSRAAILITRMIRDLSMGCMSLLKARCRKKEQHCSWSFS